MKRGGDAGGDKPQKRRRDAKPSSAPKARDAFDRKGPPPPAPPPIPGSGPDICTGRIVRYEESKGFGFIVPDRVLDGKDVFFLKSELPMHLNNAHQDQILDSRVEFEVTSGPDGKLRASRIEVMAPPPQGGGGGGGSVHAGFICAWDPAKNFGFIKCPDIHEDVFMPMSEMPEELRNTKRREDVVDTRVEFELKKMPDGKLRAIRCAIQRHPPPMPPPHMGHMGPGPSHGMHPGHQQGGGPWRQVGRICRFDRGKGFGFLECADGSPDVFFLPSSLPKDMKDSKDNFDGVEMTFEVYMNDKNQQRAKNMEIFRPGYGPPPGPPPMGPMGHMMGPPMGPMGMMGMMGPWMPPMGPPMGHMAPVDGQIFYGAIDRYDPKKGFGFIHCEPIAEDVFFLRSEMPQEIKDEGKDKVVGVQVEFEIGHREDGKMRANRLQIVPPQHMGPMDGGGGGGNRRSTGKILKFEDKKGFGFIQSQVHPQDIFFMRSALPKEKRELLHQDLVNLEVSFEWYVSDEGKPRAQTLSVVQPGPKVGRDFDEEQPIQASFFGDDDKVHTGVVLRFDPKKGYGFLEPDEFKEDVFFLRQELPMDLRESQNKDDVINLHVQFRVKTMPDGKLRGMCLELTGEAPRVKTDEPRPKKEKVKKEQTEDGDAALDPALVEEMTDFLRSNGGTFDYGKFTTRFQKIKKKQLAEHFNIVDLEEKGKQRIELRGEDIQAMEADADADAGADADADEPETMDDPAIPLGPGCCPHGVIREYNAQKGFGFIVAAGFEGDIFLPRTALPSNFQGKIKNEMPNLAGVQVSFDLMPSPGGDKGPRAEKVNLLLKFHNEDRCWLLKRESDPIID